MKKILDKKLQFAGFTLLELLVVVAVIGFLASISIVALSISQSRSRDITRKLDQVSIVKAAELYTRDIGAPPPQLQEGALNPNATQALASRQSNNISEFTEYFFEITSAKAADLELANFHIPVMVEEQCGDGGEAERCSGGGSNPPVDPPPGDCSGTCSPGYLWNINTCSCQYIQACGDGTCQDGEHYGEGDYCPDDCGDECPEPVPLCQNEYWDPFLCICDAGDGSCGNGTCNPGENNNNCSQDCPASCGNGVCEALEGFGEVNFCVNDCPICDGNLICEPNQGEHIGNCSDCSPGTPLICDNDDVCESGETPGNCANDCTNYNMCYVSGEWDLCCLFSGEYCESGGTSAGTSGYYSVCDGTQCVERYLLQPSGFTCTTDADCSPTTTAEEDKFVSDGSVDWLAPLKTYLPRFPLDPGHKQGIANDPAGLTLEEDTIRINRYYASSHPDVVKNHGLCVYAALESGAVVWPYSDIFKTPTGDNDLRWTILCSEK